MSAPRPAPLERPAPAALLRHEGLVVCLAAWLFMLATPLSLGQLGLSWDALNHHIYLGWTAQQPRFDRDYLGAGYQAFQSPYLYWPVYRMAAGGFSGMAAGAVLASLHVVIVWPVWRLARLCVPGATVFDLALRVLATALALLSAVVVSAFGSTMNDVLAAAPLVAAVALALEPAAQPGAMEPRLARRYVLLSGLGAGLAVALKLSNGPLAVLMPALWLCSVRGGRGRLHAVLLGSAGAVAAFLLAYGPWGWQLWQRFGNPVFPFQDDWFVPLRAWLHWTA